MDSRYVSSLRQQRMSWILAVLFAVWCVFIGRTFYLQVLQFDEASETIRKQSVSRTMIQPERGRIWEVSGDILADNVYTGKDTLLTKQYKLPRIHPNGVLAGQVLGRLGVQGDAQMGLEYHLDEELRGKEGWSVVKRDARKRVYDGQTIVGEEPTPGFDVLLTLDKEIQAITEAALATGVHRVQADRGCAVVVNPHNGEILAMANYPYFDPDDLSAANMLEERNDVIGKVYEPGSVFKIITAAAALEEKKLTPTDKLDAQQGRYTLPNGEVIKDTHEYGILSFAQAMAVSSNIVFLKIGQKLGQNSLFKYARSFGFGMPTGVELPGEEKGRLKPLVEWGSRTLETMSFGHEILVTPLQVAMAVSAVANGGVLYKPHLVKSYLDPKSHKTLNEIKPLKIRRVISEETAAQVRKMLKGVVDSGGTAHNIYTAGLDIAGKTGTAEKYDIKTGKYDRGSMNSSFVGMFPAEHPEFVIYVVIDQPRTVTVGGLTAGPVFKEIANLIYRNPKILARHMRSSQEAEEKLAQKDSILLDDFTLKNVNEVQKQLQSKKIKTKMIGSGNIVVSQWPQSGRKMAFGDSLQLTLTSVPPGKKLPELKGLSLKKAQQLLALKGIDVVYNGIGWVESYEWLDQKQSRIQLKLSHYRESFKPFPIVHAAPIPVAEHTGEIEVD